VFPIDSGFDQSQCNNRLRLPSDGVFDQPRQTKVLPSDGSFALCRMTADSISHYNRLRGCRTTVNLMTVATAKVCRARNVRLVPAFDRGVAERWRISLSPSILGVAKRWRIYAVQAYPIDVLHHDGGGLGRFQQRTEMLSSNGGFGQSQHPIEELPSDSGRFGRSQH
jgi:hypothetical protein